MGYREGLAAPISQAVLPAALAKDVERVAENLVLPDKMQPTVPLAGTVIDEMQPTVPPPYQIRSISAVQRAAKHWMKTEETTTKLRLGEEVIQDLRQALDKMVVERRTMQQTTGLLETEVSRPNAETRTA